MPNPNPSEPCFTALAGEMRSTTQKLHANRLYERRPLDLRVRLLTQQIPGGTVYVVRGRTVDLSCSGAGLTLSDELQPGTEVLLQLCMPGCDELKLHARVIRRRGFRVGLKFVALTAAQRLQLGELCPA